MNPTHENFFYEDTVKERDVWNAIKLTLCAS